MTVCVNDQAAHFFWSSIQTGPWAASVLPHSDSSSLYWQSDATLRKVPACDDAPQLSDLQSCSLPAYCCPGFSFFQSFTWMPADAGLSQQRPNMHHKFCFLQQKINWAVWAPSSFKLTVLLILFGALLTLYYDTDDVSRCYWAEADQMFVELKAVKSEHTSQSVKLSFPVCCVVTSHFSPLSVISG